MPRQNDKYQIGLRKGLLDPQHVRAMGPAVWLYMLYVDWQTDELGWVFSGAPIVWKRIEFRLGVGRRTLQRWQRILEGENPEEKAYVESRQLQRGFAVRILHQKKRK